MAVAMLYVLSMHLLNHLTGMAEDEYNDPERARFYERHRFLLSLLAIAAGGFGIISASAMGGVAFAILLVMSLLGLTYNLYLIPGRFGMKFRRLKDIPGFQDDPDCRRLGGGGGNAARHDQPRDLDPRRPGGVRLGHPTGVRPHRVFRPAGCSGRPHHGQGNSAHPAGKPQTFVLLKGILAVCMVLSAALAAVGLVSGLGFFLALCPAAMLVLIGAYQKGHMLPGMRLEFLVESLFLMSGLITLLWMVAAAS